MYKDITAEKEGNEMNVMKHPREIKKKVFHFLEIFKKTFCFLGGHLFWVLSKTLNVEIFTFFFIFYFECSVLISFSSLHYYSIRF